MLNSMRPAGALLGCVLLASVVFVSGVNGGNTMWTQDGDTIKPVESYNVEVSAITTSGDLIVDTNTLFVDVSENKVGVGTTSPTALLTVGSTTPSTLSGYRDAFVAGGLEVDEASYFDGALTVAGAFEVTDYINFDNTYYNTFVGYHVGSTSVADYNTAIGYSAGVYLDGGETNVFVGDYAGNNVVDGASNTFIGSGAGMLCEADENTAIGGFALQSMTSGASNVALGFQAGDQVTTGSENILLGYEAGLNLTTGSTNIIIGNGVSANAVDSTETLNIGDLIFGDLSGGYFGLGTSTPVTFAHFEEASATTTITVSSGASAKGGRLILEDIDGAGCSEITVLDGSVTAKTVACPTGI